MLFDRSLRDDFSAARSRAWAKIDNVICRANRFLIVLHHDDGIAEIAQPSQRAEQSRIVALMQPDARLIEDVKNTREIRSRSGSPVECAALRRR